MSINNFLVLSEIPEFEIYPKDNSQTINLIKDLIQAEMSYVDFLNQIKAIVEKENVVIKVNGYVTDRLEFDGGIDFVFILDNTGDIVVEKFGYIWRSGEIIYDDEIVDIEDIVNIIKSSDDLESIEMEELNESIEDCFLSSDIIMISKSLDNDNLDANYELMFLEAFPEDFSIHSSIEELEGIIEKWGNSLEDIIDNYALYLENKTMEDQGINLEKPISRYFK